MKSSTLTLCSQTAPRLIEGALEDPPLVLGVLEGHTKLEESNNRVGEVLEESIVILGVQLSVLPEALVLDNLHIGGQHHERLGLDVLELLGAVPLLVRPLLFDQQLEVVVGQRGGAEGPGAIVAGAVRVAAAERVGAGQRNHGAVVEAHAAEDGADVAAVLGCVGEAAVGCAEGKVAVAAARAVRDLGALHLLDGGDAAQDPEVRVADPGEGGLDGLEEVAGGLQTGVGAMVALGSEAHGGAVGTAGAGQLVVGAGGVPCETKQDRAVAAVIVVVVLLEQLGDVVVGLLVVLEAGDEGRPGLALEAEQLRLVGVGRVGGSTDKQDTSTDEHASGVALVLVLDGLLVASGVTAPATESILGRRSEAGRACGGGAERRRGGAQSAGEGS